MMDKVSICRNCFHSYVCEQFNENKDDNNKKCHFANDHYIPRADVVPKSEVERLQKALSKAEADVKNYMKVAEYQQSLSMKRYREIKRLKEDIERLEDINERDVENIRLAKAEVAREIFEEIEKNLFDTRIDFYEKFKFKASLGYDKEQFEYAQAMIMNVNILKKDLAELKEKYTGETP